MENLNGKTAVITGGASGIGLAMAHRFGAAGMNLVIGDIEVPAMEVAVAELTAAGYSVVSLQVDVRDIEQQRELERVAIEAFGKVHVLCNNAGVGAGGPVADPDNLEVWRWTIDIDLWGVIYGCKVFLPAMIAHGEPCHVVNTASMAGHGSAPFMGAYSVAKYGVVALSETLTKEMQFANNAVGVSVLCPAFVATGIAKSDRNMPDNLRPEPANNPVAGGMQATIESLVANGIASEVVADAVHDAVIENKFWILTHDETKPGVLERAQQIVDGVNPGLGGFL
ncbi:MAG: NAD(P)-dependent dehydrogenase (short-subunit alcohol dehydrogenase family) [Candidatus Azotimanducaceae bacterium]|jgi:NAD(P)-dependent dehydrogenase (short-subunit alcohol dehydrogenase family)